MRVSDNASAASVPCTWLMYIYVYRCVCVRSLPGRRAREAKCVGLFTRLNGGCNGTGVISEGGVGAAVGGAKEGLEGSRVSPVGVVTIF